MNFNLLDRWGWYTSRQQTGRPLPWPVAAEAADGRWIGTLPCNSSHTQQTHSTTWKKYWTLTSFPIFRIMKFKILTIDGVCIKVSLGKSVIPTDGRDVLGGWWKDVIWIAKERFGCLDASMQLVPRTASISRHDGGRLNVSGRPPHCVTKWRICFRVSTSSWRMKTDFARIDHCCHLTITLEFIKM